MYVLHVIGSLYLRLRARYTTSSLAWDCMLVDADFLIFEANSVLSVWRCPTVTGWWRASSSSWWVKRTTSFFTTSCSINALMYSVCTCHTHLSFYWIHILGISKMVQLFKGNLQYPVFFFDLGLLVFIHSILHIAAVLKWKLGHPLHVYRLRFML